MNFQTYLIDYLKQTEPILARFFKTKKLQAAEISSICSQMIDFYQDFMKGGKRVRGALMKLGYEIAGGRQKKKILTASLYPEIIHSFLLIHDDIMDRAKLRRGKQTIHLVYAALGKKFMAIDLGDLGNYLAQEILFSSNFPSKRIIRLIAAANQVFINTAFGQALDVTGEAKGEFSRAYGLPLGIAFQIQDDILGMFGEEKIIGKQSGATDIKEGKLTLLIIEVLKRVGAEEKNFLKSVYGRKNISFSQVEKIKSIVKNSGALTAVESYSRQLIKKSKEIIPQITSKPEQQEVLSDFADFVVERKK